MDCLHLTWLVRVTFSWVCSAHSFFGGLFGLAKMKERFSIVQKNSLPYFTENSNIPKNLSQMFPLKCARYCTLKLLKLDPPGPSDQGLAKSREFAPPRGFSRAPPRTAAFLNHICAGAIELRWRSCGHPAGGFSGTHGGHLTILSSDHLGRSTEAEN